MPATASFNWKIDHLILKNEIDAITIPHRPANQGGVPQGQVNFYIYAHVESNGEISLTGFLYSKASNDYFLKSASISRDTAATQAVNLTDPYYLGSLIVKHSDLVEIIGGTENIILSPQRVTYAFPPPPLTLPVSPVDTLWYTCLIGKAKRIVELYPSPPATSF